MSNAPGTAPRPTAEAIRRYVRALPATNETIALDERAAQAARSALERADSTWEQRLKAQIDTLMQEVTACLDHDSQSGRYAITDIELRGIIARAVSRAGSQIAVDIGRALSEASLAARFAIPQTGNEIDETALAKGYRQPDLQQGF